MPGQLGLSLWDRWSFTASSPGPCSDSNREQTRWSVSSAAGSLATTFERRRLRNHGWDGESPASAEFWLPTIASHGSAGEAPAPRLRTPYRPVDAHFAWMLMGPRSLSTMMRSAASKPTTSPGA